MTTIDFALKGLIGIERENLRVKRNGTLSGTRDPFKDEPLITMDFCECQPELVTLPSEDDDALLKSVSAITDEMIRTLDSMEDRELLWPFSNPPYIYEENDIPVADFSDTAPEATAYRNYLGEKYGKYKMTLSGIHVNYSLPEELLAADAKKAGSGSLKAFRSAAYLKLARGAAEYAWLLTALTAASSVGDGSFYDSYLAGKTVFSGFSSLRCSKLGYKNDFLPILDYSSMRVYAESIGQYVEMGSLASMAELYLPVRLKGKIKKDLKSLAKGEISHIELRGIDLNPFEKCGIHVNDLKFIRLFYIWLYATFEGGMEGEDQLRALNNFENSALYDIDQAMILSADGSTGTVLEKGLELLDEISAFYKNAGSGIKRVLDHQKKKLLDSGKRPAVRVFEKYKDEFVKKGLQLAAGRARRVRR